MASASVPMSPIETRACIENGFQVWKETERSLLKNAPWKKTQQNTFTNWVNSKLKVIEVSIEDLETDFSDGIRLIQLVQVLSGRKIGRFNQRPSQRVQRVENVNLALDFLINKEHIRLVNIGSVDIVDCNLKLILGLVWTLIVHYDIATAVWDDSHICMPDVEETTPKEKLMTWLSLKLPTDIGVPVRNFTTDWNSGIALGALVESCAPGLNPEWKHWHPDNKLHNATQAMHKAHTWLKIPMLLQPHEVIDPDVDEQSMMTYLSQYPTARPLPNYPQNAGTPDAQTKLQDFSMIKGGGDDGVFATPPATPASAGPTESGVRVTGAGVQAEGLVALEPTQFSVQLGTAGSQQQQPALQAIIKQPDGKTLAAQWQYEAAQFTYECHYTPVQPGLHKVSIMLNGKSISASPYKVGVAAAQVSCIGPGVDKQQAPVQFKSTTFQVLTKGLRVQTYSVKVTSAEWPAAACALQVERAEHGLTCSYTPLVSGELTVQVMLNEVLASEHQVLVAANPLLLSASHATAVHTRTHCFTARLQQGGELPSALHCKVVTVSGRSEVPVVWAQVHYKSAKDAYAVSYTPVCYGKQRIHMQIEAQQLGSEAGTAQYVDVVQPVDIHVQPDASLLDELSFNVDVSEAVAGHLKLQLHGAEADRIVFPQVSITDINDDKQLAVEPKIEHMGDNVYSVRFDVPGDHVWLRLHVLYNDTHLKHSPRVFSTVRCVPVQLQSGAFSLPAGVRTRLIIQLPQGKYQQDKLRVQFKSTKSTASHWYALSEEGGAAGKKSGQKQYSCAPVLPDGGQFAVYVYDGDQVIAQVAQPVAVEPPCCDADKCRVVDKPSALYPAVQAEYVVDSSKAGRGTLEAHVTAQDGHTIQALIDESASGSNRWTVRFIPDAGDKSVQVRLLYGGRCIADGEHRLEVQQVTPPKLVAAASPSPPVTPVKANARSHHATGIDADSIDSPAKSTEKSAAKKRHASKTEAHQAEAEAQAKSATPVKRQSDSVTPEKKQSESTTAAKKPAESVTPDKKQADTKTPVKKQSESVSPTKKSESVTPGKKQGGGDSVTPAKEGEKMVGPTHGKQTPPHKDKAHHHHGLHEKDLKQTHHTPSSQKPHQSGSPGGSGAVSPSKEAGSPGKHDNQKQSSKSADGMGGKAASDLRCVVKGDAASGKLQLHVQGLGSDKRCPLNIRVYDHTGHAVHSSTPVAVGSQPVVLSMPAQLGPYLLLHVEADQAPIANSPYLHARSPGVPLVSGGVLHGLDAHDAAVAASQPLILYIVDAPGPVRAHVTKTKKVAYQRRQKKRSAMGLPPESNPLECAVSECRPGVDQLRFTPIDAGVYKLHLAAQPDCPIQFVANVVGHAEKCRLTQAPEHLAIGEEVKLTVDCRDAGQEGALTAQLYFDATTTKPHGQHGVYIQPQVSALGDGVYGVRFSVQESGSYSLYIKWGGQLIHDGDVYMTAVKGKSSSVSSMSGPKKSKQNEIAQPDASTPRHQRSSSVTSAAAATGEHQGKTGGQVKQRAQSTTHSATPVTTADKHRWPRLNTELTCLTVTDTHLDAKLDAPMIFVIERQLITGELDIHVDGPDQCNITYENSDQGILVSCLFPQPGLYTFRVTCEGKHIISSPFTVLVGQHAEKENQSGGLAPAKTETAQAQPLIPTHHESVEQPLCFVVARELMAGGQICIDVNGPAKAELTYETSEQGVKVTCKFVEPGAYTFSIECDGQHIGGSPLKVHVGGGAHAKHQLSTTESVAVTTAQQAQHKSTIGGKHAEQHKVNISLVNGQAVSVNEVISFTVGGLAAGSELRVGVKGPADPQLSYEQVDPTTIKVSGVLSAAGEYELSVLVSGVEQAAYTVCALDTAAHTAADNVHYRRVSQSTYRTYSGEAHMVRCEGSGLRRASRTQVNTFSVNTSNAGTDILYVAAVTDHGPVNTLTLTHQGNGVYQVAYKCDQSGQLLVCVKYGDNHVPGSPFIVDV